MTSFSIHRSHLLPLLDAAADVVARRNTIPILGNVALAVDGDALTVRATDLERMVTACGPLADCGAAGGFTVPALMLRDIVKALPESAEIAFALSGNGERVSVQSGRSRYRLQWLPESDFPDIAASAMTHRFALEGGDLAAAIEAVEFAISTEETRYYLNGIYLHVVEDELLFVATDGHRLGRTRLPAPAFQIGEARDLPSAIVPRAFCSLVRKAGALAGEAEVTVELGEAKIALTREAGDLRFQHLSKLIDGTFPDYQRTIPQDRPNVWLIESGDLAAAAARASLIGAHSRALRLSFAGDELAIDAVSPDHGDASETLSAECEAGKGVILGLNARYLGDILTALGKGQVTLRMASPGDPVRLAGRSPASDYVLMPMRV